MFLSLIIKCIPREFGCTSASSLSDYSLCCANFLSFYTCPPAITVEFPASIRYLSKKPAYRTDICNPLVGKCEKK